MSDSALDAAALAGDDGVGRLVEQHEHRLDRRPPCLSLSRNRISALMSTSAKSLVPAATRAIASGDPLAMLVVTASPSALNRPPAGRHHERRAAASIGRSSENWIASGGRGSSAARHCSPSSPQSRTPAKAKQRGAQDRERMALVRTARIELTSARGGTSCRAGDDCFMTSHDKNTGMTSLGRHSAHLT
jgi:hypothetical protein